MYIHTAYKHDAHYDAPPCIPFMCLSIRHSKDVTYSLNRDSYLFSEGFGFCGTTHAIQFRSKAARLTKKGKSGFYESILWDTGLHNKRGQRINVDMGIGWMLGSVSLWLDVGVGLVNKEGFFDVFCCSGSYCSCM